MIVMGSHCGSCMCAVVQQDGWTALMWACTSGHTEVVKLLVRGGAKVNMQHEVGVGRASQPLRRTHDICQSDRCGYNVSLNAI